MEEPFRRIDFPNGNDVGDQHHDGNNDEFVRNHSDQSPVVKNVSRNRI